MWTQHRTGDAACTGRTQRTRYTGLATAVGNHVPFIHVLACICLRVLLRYTRFSGVDTALRPTSEPAHSELKTGKTESMWHSCSRLAPLLVLRRRSGTHSPESMEPLAPLYTRSLALPVIPVPGGVKCTWLPAKNVFKRNNVIFQAAFSLHLQVLDLPQRHNWFHLGSPSQLRAAGRAHKDVAPRLLVRSCSSRCELR